MNRCCNQCGDDLIDGTEGRRCPKCILALALEPEDDERPSFLAIGTRFGGYELLEEIARGGMGVVYKAKQVALNRVVALKLILSGQFASKQEVLRFRLEAEAAANLRHPNIVAIYETGEELGQQFFSMEFVEGRTLTDIVHDGLLQPKRAATYAETIARAIQHAHEQGTVHRDLKPSNVMIDVAGQVRVTDFGLAKRLQDDPELTATGQVMGSPSFMPPEQSSGARSALGPAADVYGIGAILYYLLTGRPPFQAATMAEIVRQLHEQDPVPPRLLVPNIAQDLQTIVLKCLEKDPAKRFATAAELAEELGRFLRDEPVRARPVGALEKAWRWCRRKPVVAALLIALGLALLSGTGGVLWQWRHATTSARALRHGLYSADINLASHLRTDRDINRAVGLLLRHVPKRGEEDLRGFEWRLLWEQCQGEETDSIMAHDGDVDSLALTPDGEHFLTTGSDHTAKLWNLRTLKLERILKTLPGKPPLHSVAVSADGGKAAVCDGLTVTVLETKGWSEIKTLAVPTLAVAFSPKTGALMTSAGADIKAWDPNTWIAQTLVDGPLELFAFSPDGRLLAVARGEDLELHDGSNGRLLVRLPGKIENHAYALAFSPDGRFVAAGGMYGGVIVWDVAAEKVVAKASAHTSFVSGLAFSPDGRWLATGGSDQFLTIGRVSDWHKEADLYGHKNGVFDLTFTPDGRRLVSASRDHTVKFWKVPVEPNASMLGDAQALIGFTADSRTAVTLDTDATLRQWDVASLDEIKRNKLSAQVRATAGTVAPDGKTVAIGYEDGFVEFRDLPTSDLLHRGNGGTNAVCLLQFSPDGRVAAGTGIFLHGLPTTSGILGLWDVATGDRLTKLEESLGGSASGISFSHDGQLIAISRPDLSILIWDRVRNKPLRTLTGHTWDVSSVTFSPDDRTLASSSWDTTVRLWDVATGREIAQFAGLPVGAGPACFSPDGRTLAATFVGNAIELWHMSNQQELLTLKWSGRFIGPLLFSPDGTTMGVGRLLPISPDGGVQLWRAPVVKSAALPPR